MKKIEWCRSKFGMTGKLAALVLGTAMAFVSVTGCSNPSGGGSSGGGNTPATYIGTKAPSEAKEVGDIVFNDGSAIPYSEGLSLSDAQKNAAIAIIFYKGTECSNDSASRTLGVGLKRSPTRPRWCPGNSVNAYNRNITTIQCTKEGDTISGDKNGSDNLAQIGAFLESADGVEDDTGDEAKYPAFYFAKNYSDTAENLGSYAAGWYLPSIAELDQIYKNKATVNAAIELCGGDKFGSDKYWSSSQETLNALYAHSLIFNTGEWYPTYKDNYFYVCAVREF